MYANISASHGYTFSVEYVLAEQPNMKISREEISQMKWDRITDEKINYDEENKKRYAMEEKMLEEYRTIYQGGEGELIERSPVLLLRSDW